MTAIMEKLSFITIDNIFITVAIIIWISLVYNLILMYHGYKYFLEIKKIEKNFLDNMVNFPMVTILIPAHNEEKVIVQTLFAMENFNYPKDKLKIIVINDRSTDNTKLEVENFLKGDNRSHFMLIETDEISGGKGKSGALNYGIQFAEGDYICVYDADNTPEPNALKYLVKTITDGDYGAVVGKFRTRNKIRNLLTKMINIEGISFQWLAQGGRSHLWELCTIPGTNYIISRKDLESIGGFDIKAIAEDTEISIKLYRSGRRIKFMPLAVTWEQEPETLQVFFKQRIRWIKGNLYVIFKYCRGNPFSKNGKYYMDIIYFFLIYILFLFSVILSHTIFLLNLIFGMAITVQGNVNLVWFLTFLLYILQVANTLSFEKGELNRESFFIIILSYFTYTQLWLYMAIVALFQFTRDSIFKRETIWYKTERF